MAVAARNYHFRGGGQRNRYKQAARGAFQRGLKRLAIAAVSCGIGTGAGRARLFCCVAKIYLSDNGLRGGEWLDGTSLHKFETIDFRDIDF